MVSQCKAKEISLAEPHLLYMTEQQSRLYEKATAENHNYADLIDKPICDLLAKHLDEILERLTDTVAFIDLGPGYPNKSLLVIDHLLPRRISITYYPVDVSPYFLKEAVEAVENKGVHAIPLLERFETLGSILDLNTNSTTRVLFLGLTFNNFEIDRILGILANITRIGDLCLVCVQTPDGLSLSEIVKPYTGEKIEAFAFQPLKAVGFSKYDFEYQPVFEDNCVKTRFTLLRDLSLRGCPFLKGQHFVTAKSYRLPLPTVREEVGKKLRLIREYTDAATNITLMQLTGIAARENLRLRM
jgi:uncharacterized SAM-dependent methyltransferase